MKIPLILFLITFIVSSPAFSQEVRVEKSQSFPVEEISSRRKVLILKNSGTAIVSDGGDYLWLQIFDSSRKTIVRKTVPTRFDNKKGKLPADTHLVGAFSSGEELVVFLETVVDKIPVVHRLRISAQNGEVISEDEIIRSTKEPGSAIKALETSPSFRLRKDPFSGCYAIASTDNRISDITKRIEIIHFAQNHEIVHRGFLEFPDRKHWARDMAVLGSSKVIIYAQGTARKVNVRYVAALEKGNTRISPVQLSMGNEPDDISGQLKISPDRARILAVMCHKSKDYEVTTTVMEINPADLSVIEQHQIVLPASINEQHKKLMDTKDDILALPQSLDINKDGSYTLTYECQTSNANFIFADEVVVLHLDNKFNLRHSYLIPKRQVIDNLVWAFTEIRDETVQGFEDHHSFTSITRGNGQVLFVNERIDNIAGTTKEWIPTDRHQYTDAFMYTLNEGKSQPFIVLDKPTEYHTNGGFKSGAYDEVTNTYVFVADPEIEPLMCYVVWLKLP